jgi:CubicO group peptidase (beta-lactamase class C family)
MWAACSIDEDGRLDASGHVGDVPGWSFTKTILGTTALRLVAEGALVLDQTLPSQRFTLRRLLQHQAGLPVIGLQETHHSLRHEPPSACRAPGLNRQN